MFKHGQVCFFFYSKVVTCLFVYCANEKPVSLKLVLVKSEIVSFVVVDNDKEQSVRSAYIKRLLITVKKREGGGLQTKR